MGKGLSTRGFYPRMEDHFYSLSFPREVYEIKRRFVLKTMAIPVVEFSREGYKIRKIFGQPILP